MIALPDYIVLDFLDWIAKENLIDDMFFQILLNDRKLATFYAREYLREKDGMHSKRKYRQCKQYLKICINKVIDSEEFDEFLKRCCKCNNCKYYDKYHCLYECLDKYFYQIEKFLHDRRQTMEIDLRYESKNIECHDLVDSLYFYIDKNTKMDNLSLLHLMIGNSTSDLSSILDFLHWLKNRNQSFNFYKMPQIVFKDIIKEYELSREICLSNRTRKNITKCFNNKCFKQVYERGNKIFGIANSVSLSNIFERYYNDKAKYKCILLPIKAESDFEKFVKKYYYDLDEASSDFLDIFYSFKELKDTGYKVLEKIKDLEVDINMLPCIVIWQKDISVAKSINIRRLNHSDLFELLKNIISFIKNGMNLEEIYIEILKIIENLQEEKKMVQKFEQNINGSSYGQIIGINNGTANNKVLMNDLDIQKDIEQAKIKINELGELNSENKEFLYQLLEDVGISILNNDVQLKNACISKWQGFSAAIGRLSIDIIGVLGSIASIASFFGFNVLK